MSARYWFTLPDSFHPGEFLKSPKLPLYLDDARYFVHLVLTKTARWEVDANRMVRLHATYLRNIMHQKYYAAVVDAIVDGGAVVRAPYRPGERSFGYRLADRYINDRHVRVPATDLRLIHRLELFHEQAEAKRKSRMKAVHFALERKQKRLNIQADVAREIISGLPRESNPFDVQGIIVADIERRDFHCNVGWYGRFSNNITSMSRKVRPALHVDGEPLKSVDISCCQPALIAFVMESGKHPALNRRKGQGNTQNNGEEQTEHGNNSNRLYDSTIRHPDSGDFELYRQLVQSGEFYDFMVAELSDHGISREQFKRRFLADVIAKRKANPHGAEYPSVVEAKFRELFPSVYQFIRYMNRNGWEHENLIRELQRQESRLVIEQVAADFVTVHRKTFAITLHDSIFTVESDLVKVEQAFHRTFDRNGFRMNLKNAA